MRGNGGVGRTKLLVEVDVAVVAELVCDFLDRPIRRPGGLGISWSHDEATTRMLGCLMPLGHEDAGAVIFGWEDATCWKSRVSPRETTSYTKRFLCERAIFYS